MPRKLILFIAVALAACSTASPAPAAPPILVTQKAPAQTEAASQPPVDAPTLAPARTGPSVTGQELARSDSQGAVEFVVTPLNLNAVGETLDFDVSMNTHSVDLSWDLAAQSTLTTDTGLEVEGLSWPVGSGHHYEGTLTFPAKTGDGKPLLDATKKLMLTIREAGAAERVFEWDLSN